MRERQPSTGGDWKYRGRKALLYYICVRLLTIYSFWGVFWVDVASLLTAKNNFLATAKTLGSSAESVDKSP
ncbi:hypothetical protein COCMIDRAFT_107613 [Bipolaris oryzae ATCC 44560]|uniref:Uncharacterized protein n=1 Tax=Bipolaris oryzae ATCC 44560 TaxID=930090 RepID=W6YTL6_COCMI|nr:uncharacterized protein COCMIDRAFT_107613 [Bipolaris oryzae ATCC 44560]EUC40878.1 hypothetical protein COCMIDRAFT_107613 [Bipolaris oryzae ATCC 44560]